MWKFRDWFKNVAMQGLVQLCGNVGIGLKILQFSDWFSYFGNVGIGLKMWQCKDWFSYVAIKGLVQKCGNVRIDKARLK